MDTKAKKQFEALKTKVQRLEKQILGARQQLDDPAELAQLQKELAEVKNRMAELKKT